MVATVSINESKEDTICNGDVSAISALSKVGYNKNAAAALENLENISLLIVRAAIVADLTVLASPLMVQEDNVGMSADAVKNNLTPSSMSS